MAEPSPLLIAVATAVSDSRPVDWDRVEREASSEERAALQELAALEALFSAMRRR